MAPVGGSPAPALSILMYVTALLRPVPNPHLTNKEPKAQGHSARGPLRGLAQPTSEGPGEGPLAAGRACWTPKTRSSVQACHSKPWYVGLPWWFSGQDLAFPVQSAWAQSLVRELDPHMPHAPTKSSHATTRKNKDPGGVSAGPGPSEPQLITCDLGVMTGPGSQGRGGRAGSAGVGQPARALWSLACTQPRGASPPSWQSCSSLSSTSIKTQMLLGKNLWKRQEPAPGTILSDGSPPGALGWKVLPRPTA